MTVDVKSYRDAMSRLGAAVNIVTTTDDLGWYGMTASAVCSVTDTPPTLLVCVNRSAHSHHALKVTCPICVNTLAHEQKDISVAFSGGSEMAERFTSGYWTTCSTGAPVLEQALVSFDCLISQVVEVGTHSVIFCDVQYISLGDPVEALLYFNRTYRSLPYL